MIPDFQDRSLFEKSLPGTGAFSDTPDYRIGGMEEPPLPESLKRKSDIGLPELSERDLVMHFTNLADRNYSVDGRFYPLGSCTMKYNPKINERIASLEGFVGLHPLQDPRDCQGMLECLFAFERTLAFITGMNRFSLQPAAGAQGELAALLMAKKYFRSRGEKRTKVVVPDSSHGTNPASASLAGFRLVTIASRNGEVDLDALKAQCDEDLAVFMLTNPNTLGLFEKQVETLCESVHACGGLAYLDGANMNALLGIARPGAMGFDLMHLNLHKTFATPHGGGGPGSGPLGAHSRLARFLPGPLVSRDEKGRYLFNDPDPESIGDMKAFWGNIGVIIRAAAYVDALGRSGLRRTAENAILAANYLRVRLRECYSIPFDRPCMHEFVMTPDAERSPAKTLDIAKRLPDYGMHAPTVYFPLIVKEALMIEPTETESLKTLDAFVDAMLRIAREAKENPEILKSAPRSAYRSRLDEVLAARRPRLKWGDA